MCQFLMVARLQETIWQSRFGAVVGIFLTVLLWVFLAVVIHEDAGDTKSWLGCNNKGSLAGPGFVLWSHHHLVTHCFFAINHLFGHRK